MRSSVLAVALSAVAVAACTATIPPGMTPVFVPTFAPPTSPGQGPTVGARGSNAGGQAAPSAQATPGAQATATAVPSVGGPGSSREDPLALGTEFDIGDWRVTVESVDKDAWDVIHAENQFNSPPPTGRQFVLFVLSATYVGTETGNAWIDLAWRVVGSAGNTFGASMDDYCGVIPDSLSNEGETFPNGTMQGSECISVESGQLDGATLMAQDFLSDTRVFIAMD